TSLTAQVEGHLMVGDPLIPPTERPPGGFLDHGLLVIVSGETPHRVHAGEPCDGGEHDLLAFVPAQQPGAAETVDAPQILADLVSVVPLVVAGGRPRRPSAPYPRDHLTLIPPVLDQAPDDNIPSPARPPARPAIGSTGLARCRGGRGGQPHRRTRQNGCPA